MSDPLSARVDEVLSRLQQAREIFCGLDYDGTLAPIAPRPDAAMPYPGTEALLLALAATNGTRVAIVTGRSIADVGRFLDLAPVYYVGVHGYEVRRPGATVEASRTALQTRQQWPRLATEVARRLAGIAGIFLEDKGVAVAAHYRGVPPADAVRTCAIVEEVGSEHLARGESIEILHGHSVIELRPTGIDKGKTLCELIAADAPGSLALYIGDDRTDEDAFRALPPGSITVRVGPAGSETAADYSVAGPADVHAFLRQLLHARLGDTSPRG